MAVSLTESKTKAIKAAPLNLNPVDMSCKRIYPFLASIRIKGRRRSPRSYHYQEKDLFLDSLQFSMGLQPAVLLC